MAIVAAQPYASWSGLTPRTDVTIIWALTLDNSTIDAFSFLSAMNIMKPTCDDPSLLSTNNPSVKTIISQDSKCPVFCTLVGASGISSHE